MSLRSRFLFIMGALCTIAIILIGIASYKFSKQNAIKEAKNKGQIIFNYILAGRQYFKDEQRPLIMELVEEDRFYPELMSGFVVTRGTWEIFSKKLPGYKFKQATIDPLWPPNKADKDELEIIRHFQQNPELKKQEGLFTKGEEEYYYFAKPLKIDSKKCLRCHGDPLNAPKDQIEIYGSETGYHWKLGDTVSAFIVYVPLKQALASAFRTALFLISIGAICFLLVLLVIWFFLDRRVVAPIIELSGRTEEISVGKNLAQGVETRTDDEIGLLAVGIDRLRISMLKLLERCSND